MVVAIMWQGGRLWWSGGGNTAAGGLIIVRVVINGESDSVGQVVAIMVGGG